MRVQVFPYGESGYAEETSQVRMLKAGAWDTLVFDLPEVNSSGPLRIDPGCETGFVEVGDILVERIPSGDLVWSSPSSSPEREFKVAGTAEAPFAANESFFMSIGEDPQLLVTLPAGSPERLKLTIALRVSPASKVAVDKVVSELQAALNRQHQNAIAGDEFKQQMKACEEAKQRAQAQSANLEAQLTQLRDSLSWRMTSPIRKLKAGFKG